MGMCNGSGACEGDCEIRLVDGSSASRAEAEYSPCTTSLTVPPPPSTSTCHTSRLSREAGA